MRTIQSCDPFGDSGFASVDLLAAANEANDRCPVLSLIQRPDQKSSLRHGEVRDLQFVAIGSTAFEIIGESFVCPGTLRFVENGNVFYLAIPGLFKLNRLSGSISRTPFSTGFLIFASMLSR